MKQEESSRKPALPPESWIRIVRKGRPFRAALIFYFTYDLT